MADLEHQTSWYVRLDRWHPSRLNQLLSAHWAVRNRMKKHDEQIIGLAVRGADVPEATGKRRVSLVITLAPRQRAGDPDAYWKSTLDALVKCGALVNDSPVWCELGSVEFERGQQARTVIRLEDVAAPKVTPKEGKGEDRHALSNAEQRAGKRRFRVSMV